MRIQEKRNEFQVSGFKCHVPPLPVGEGWGEGEIPPCGQRDVRHHALNEYKVL